MKNLRRIFPGILTPRILYNKPIGPVKKMSLPDRIMILIKQASSSEVSVSPGNRVNSGQRIGISEANPVFTTITGMVSSISDLDWLNGESYHAVEIKRDGEDQWEPLFTGTEDMSKINREELLFRLESAGYPLDIYKRKKIDTMIVNCCENDILTSNIQASIIDRKDLLRSGLALAGLIGNCGHIILAVQSGFEKQISEITEADIRVVKPIYPWCMDELLPRYLKEYGSVGIINAELLMNIAETAKTGYPMHEKVFTLIGEGKLPIKNIRARIGTPVSDILDHEKIIIGNEFKIVLGGAMCGLSIYSRDFPIQKETDGLLIQGRNDVIEISKDACLNCGLCVRACPQNLQVNLLARYSEFSLFERCEGLNIWDCIECGMCAYVCTSHRPLVQFIQFGKKELIKLKELAKEEAANDN